MFVQHSLNATKITYRQQKHFIHSYITELIKKNWYPLNSHNLCITKYHPQTEKYITNLKQTC